MDVPFCEIHAEEKKFATAAVGCFRPRRGCSEYGGFAPAPSRAWDDVGFRPVFIRVSPHPGRASEGRVRAESVPERSGRPFPALTRI